MKAFSRIRKVMLALALTPIAAFAQITDDVRSEEVAVPTEIDPNEVLSVVEQMPEFPGGHEAMMAYMNKNLTYPEVAKEEEIEGKVFLSFVVERDGGLSDVKTLRSPHPSLDREAVRVVKSMPKWAPGKQNGEPCRVRYTLPVIFKLSN